MRVQTFILLAPAAVLAVTPRARTLTSKAAAQMKLTNSFSSLDTCGLGYETCENSCMPEGDVCCNDNTDEYCLAGYYCIPNACCPEGETCDDVDEDTGSCSLAEVECGDLCMPYDGTCCPDELHYCPDFGTCTSDGYCCDLGDDCDSGSSTFTWDDDSTTATATATADDSSFTQDATTTSDSSFPTSDSDSTSTSSDDSSSNSNTSPVTVTVQPSSTTAAQGAGPTFAADGKVAAGLAVAAALLI
ncbi:hypothetical protein F5Y15DRAFT_278485 [Xylariaceae sp. FL0016]|nr:hypothetical protein F5Y15DRAFT_278485 [Xylariaceae sp. FL0016]